MRADYPAGYPISSYNEESRGRYASRPRTRVSLFVARSFIRRRRVTRYKALLAKQTTYGAETRTGNAFNSFRPGETGYLHRAIKSHAPPAHAPPIQSAVVASIGLFVRPTRPYGPPEIVPRSRSPSRHCRIGNIWVDLPAKHAFNRRESEVIDARQQHVSRLINSPDA